ncbi:MAG: hypothetical protein R2771_12045 [Saprospiraceae bacterium]
MGTTEVINIEDLSRPEIHSNTNKICYRDEVFLESTHYSNNVKYLWYYGSYPSGIFIDSTEVPYITLKPGVGTNYYYVIAETANCVLFIFSTAVEVINQPIASIKDPL